MVVDTFRIPQSPKYMGDGPCPLKITFLTGDMASDVRERWTRLKRFLPRGIRLRSSQGSQNRTAISGPNRSPTNAGSEKFDTSQLKDRDHPGRVVDDVAPKNAKSPTGPRSAQL